jgi:tetratricopeptide (TPR) repeat protein
MQWAVSHRRWVGPCLGLVGVAVAIVAFWSPVFRLWSGPPLERGRYAYESGDWSKAVALADDQLGRAPGDPEGLRLRARGMARLGRDREALRQYATIGAEPLRAEDLCLIGQGLIRQGRSGLGMGALDAASKLDPNHQETIAALAGLHGRLGTPVADLAGADRLTAVPSGPALRQLVVGLLAIVPDKETPDGLDPSLDRLLHHDRPEFLAIDGPPAARKLLARLLLEQGRATEARGWLDKAGEVDDPEMDWLRSRAYLVEGAIEQARASVVRAGDFGRDAPLTHEPSRYMGAKRCAGCHGVIYRTQQTSRHAQTLAQGESLASVPLPKAAVADPEAPGVTHRFERSGSEIRVAVETDGGLIRAVVDYALGSGHHGVTMLARDETGRHRSMRISYYSAGDYWGITSGFNPHPTDRESYLGNALSDAGLHGCLDCHSTRYPPSEGKRSPEAADRGIGCERCHGPGDHHLRAVEAGFPQLAIARPKLATPAQRMALCGQCHSADGDTPPSDPRFIRFQATTLCYSRCVTESGGRLDCVTCHDPHKNVETNTAHYEARCLSCHAVNSARCPVNAKTGCLGCHMPRVENVMPFTSFTDHHIRVHRVEGAVNKSGITR